MDERTGRDNERVKGYVKLEIARGAVKRWGFLKKGMKGKKEGMKGWWEVEGKGWGGE